MRVPQIPYLPQSVSINRVRIIDLPGLDVDNEVTGEQAYNLLSAPAIVRYALDNAPALDLPQHYRTGSPDRPELRHKIPLLIDANLSHSDPVIRGAAQDIATRLGRNLGYILLTLHRGDPVNRKARSDWSIREWTKWHTITNVCIGGGIVSGKLGDRLISVARKLINDSGYGDVLDVRKSQLTRGMAVIGACRYFCPGTRTALCLDFGHTSVKAAIACFEDDALIDIQWLPTQPVAWHWRNQSDAGKGIDPQKVRDFVVQAIFTAWESGCKNGLKLDPDMMVSIAAYVRDGSLTGHGIYARMNLISDDTQILLEESIRYKYNVDVKINLIHDGTAAAALHAGKQHTAVLVLGTAIGVGFAPTSSLHLRSIHSRILNAVL